MSRMMSCELSLALSGSLWLDLAHFCTLWLIPSYSGHLWVTLTRSLAHSRSLWLTLPHSFSFWLSMALSLSGLFGSLGFSVSLRPYRSLTLDPSGSFNNSLSPLGSFWLTPALYLALSSTWGRHQWKKTFSFGHCPTRGNHAQIFWPFFKKCIFGQ